MPTPPNNIMLFVKELYSIETQFLGEGTREALILMRFHILHNEKRKFKEDKKSKKKCTNLR